MNENIIITWYGRCCFLVEKNDKKILFDPYDTFCKVDIDKIDSDILISSSTWHDHGHIGASPNAFIYTYPGTYEKGEIKITGIEALEDRGSPTVIFNILFGEFSITNFADFGAEQKAYFDSHVSQENLEVLKTTNIAFVRPSINKDGTHEEIALNYCQPAIIIPEHYFPRSFIEAEVEKNKKSDFLQATKVGEDLIEKIDYPVSEINSCEVSIGPEDLKNKKLIKFMKLHPQVKYLI